VRHSGRLWQGKPKPYGWWPAKYPSQLADPDVIRSGGWLIAGLAAHGEGWVKQATLPDARPFSFFERSGRFGPVR